MAEHTAGGHRDDLVDLVQSDVQPEVRFAPQNAPAPGISIADVIIHLPAKQSAAIRAMLEGPVSNKHT